MAVTKTITKSNTNFTFTVTLTESNVNESTNTSYVTASIKVQSRGYGGDYAQYWTDISVTYGGKTLYSFSNYTDCRANQSFTKTGSAVKFDHNSDGSFSGTVSCSISSPNAYGYAIGTISMSEAMSLTTIPRASSISISGHGSIGNNATITISKASSAFTHTLTYNFGSASGTIATKTSSSSVSWTVPASLANQLPTSTSGSGTITCYTYNGNTQIGTTSISFTTSVPSSYVPSISVSCTVVSGKLGNAIVQNKTLMKVTNNAGGSGGSYITSYYTTITGFGSPFSNSSFNFYPNSSGRIYISTTVTDSRGRTNSAQTYIDVTAYSNPSVYGFTAYRVNDSGNRDDRGSRLGFSVGYNIASVDNNNGRGLRIDALINGSWVTVKTASLTSYSGTWTDTERTRDYGVSSVLLRARVADNYTYNTVEVYLPSVATIMNVRSNGNGMGIGMVNEHDGGLDVGYDVWMNKALRVTEWISAGSKSTMSYGYRVHRAHGNSGSQSWVQIANITLTGSWGNAPLRLYIGQRGKSGISELNICFSQGEGDSSLSYFWYTGGSVSAIISKVDTNRWALYINKAEGYDDITVIDIKYPDYQSDRMNIEWVDVAIASPSGTTAVNQDIENRSYVGMVIMSTTLSTEAQVKAWYGGTSWSMSTDRFLIGAGGSYAINSTGGVTEVTLTAAQSGLPSHSHTFTAIQRNSAAETLASGAYGYTAQSKSTDATGGTNASQAHTNMPPYRAVYIWIRTA